MLDLRANKLVLPKRLAQPLFPILRSGKNLNKYLLPTEEQAFRLIKAQVLDYN